MRVSHNDRLAAGFEICLPFETATGIAFKKKGKTPTEILTTKKVWKGTFTQYQCIGEQKQIGEKLFQCFQRILNVRNRFLKMKF